MRLRYALITLNEAYAIVLVDGNNFIQRGTQMLRHPFIIIAYLSAVSSAFGALPTSYILKLQLPPRVHIQEEICGFYKGKHIVFDGSMALIPEHETNFTFSIIITPEVRFSSVKNNVQHIKRIKDVACSWYDITFRQDGLTPYWEINKLDLKDAPMRIPDHGIILLLDPDIIESLIQPSVSPSRNSPHIRQLPQIILRPETTEEELNSAYTEGHLASVHLRTIHHKHIPVRHTRELSHCCFPYHE